MYAIQTHDLTKIYGKKHAVDHLNMTVHEGDIYGFVGNNGAGKSTTMKMIAGLAPPPGARSSSTAGQSGLAPHAAMPAAQTRPKRTTWARSSRSPASSKPIPLSTTS